MLRLLSGIGFCLFLASCGGADVAGTGDPLEDRPVVYATNHPLAHVAERLAGDAIDLRFPAADAGDPAHWTPDEATLAAMQDAELILLNGAGYEPWAATAALPFAATVDTTAGVADRLVAVEDSETHRHGPEGAHSHGGTAFTTWLDPELFAAQTRSVADALVRLLPDRRAGIERRLAELERDLAGLRSLCEEIRERDLGHLVIGSHPVYQYLAQATGLRVHALHWEPDTMPGDDEWTALAELVDEDPPIAFCWEAEPDPAIAARLAEVTDAAQIVFPPCATPPDGDLIPVLEGAYGDLLSALPSR